MALPGERTAVNLANELDGGRTFVFLLRVVNFLGQTSEPFEIIVLRDAAAIPSITISAPPLLSFRSTDTIALQASATLASCFTGDALRINFLWTLTSTVLTANAPLGTAVTPLALDAPTITRRDLTVKGSTMLPGLLYTLRVRGCMAVDTSVCGYASTNISLVNQPLRAIINGGSVRTAGEDSPLSIDACGSGDPDDAFSTITYDWTCAIEVPAVLPSADGSAAPPAPPAAACAVTPCGMIGWGRACGKRQTSGAIAIQLKKGSVARALQWMIGWGGACGKRQTKWSNSYSAQEGIDSKDKELIYNIILKTLL